MPVPGVVPAEEINDVLGDVGAEPVLERTSWRIEAIPKSRGLGTVFDKPDEPDDSADPTGESYKKNWYIIIHNMYNFVRDITFFSTNSYLYRFTIIYLGRIKNYF